ncbi:YggT family protein [Seleniivibrio sp.]|uniref:YggT family protein n=1 Tax=Seleniivibrio sp. TaxID=2898801 RepID=UPI0025E31940|nr:YggT family protein [Seleniivibrio sp.]MCD8553322.1 YggT family protein [Seleniivibrio sp.]
MAIISMLIKSYLVVLLLRSVMTRQELYFNPIGKMVAKLTDPLMEKLLKLNKKNADRSTVIFILLATALTALLYYAMGGMSFVISAFFAISDMLNFLMMFYIVSIILGIFAGNGRMSYFSMYFNRLGSFWVNAVRAVLPIRSNAVAVPAIVLVFVFFTVVNGAVILFMQHGTDFTFVSSSLISSMFMSLKSGLLSIVSLLGIYIWVIIIRALMSWVSPDPSNPVVQTIIALTDPVLVPFSRIIPPLGPVDISPMILIFLLYFLKNMLLRLIGMLL